MVAAWGSRSDPMALPPKDPWPVLLEDRAMCAQLANPPRVAASLLTPTAIWILPTGEQSSEGRDNSGVIGEHCVQGAAPHHNCQRQHGCLLLQGIWKFQNPSTHCRDSSARPV